MPRRRFLDWSVPLLPSLADRLLPERGSGPLDLGDAFVISPTRQAGRRLREYLAGEWRRRGGTALLSMEVHPPSFLLQPAADVPVAHAFDWLPAWRDTLAETDLRELPALMPGRSEPLSTANALEFGRRLQRLREELLDAGFDLSGVADRPVLQSEQERWRDLARLENLYRDRLRTRGLVDPSDAKRASLAAWMPPSSVKRLILAGVPDPSPVVLNRLKELDGAVGLDIEVWIHAPETEADAFDDWGRPLSVWRERFLGPDAMPVGWLENLPDPAALARRVGGLISAAPEHPDLAFGLLDDDLLPPIQHALEAAGRELYHPKPRKLEESSLVRLLSTLQEQRIHDDPQSLRALWRLPDLLRTLSPDEPEVLLREWDRYAETSFPGSAAAVDATVSGDILPAAWSRLRDWLAADTPLAWLEMLREVYRETVLDPENPAHRYRLRQITAAAELLQEAARREREGRAPDPAVLLQALREETVDPPRTGGTLTAEGWLELSYHPAPALLLAGMHDGRVPASRPVDPFLPNQLREELGLRSDRDWTARDAYLFHTLLSSRSPGKVRVLVAKRDRDGGPVLPSRLLFACPDAELLRRAELLFREPPPPPVQPPPSPGLEFVPARAKAHDIGSLSVTAVNDYLQCPTRFYLKHVLGMRHRGDTVTEPDAAVFGTLLHAVLERLVREGVREADLWDRECERLLDEKMRECFGPDRDMSLRVLEHGALARLRAAGRVQLALWEEGWTPVAFEVECSRTCGGMKIVGKIDRVDLHPELGVRILDYKTSDSPEPPAKIHLGTARENRPELHVEAGRGVKQWTNLQLPLYRWLAEEQDVVDSALPLEVGYFNLPKSVSKTGVEIWEGEAELREPALRCLEEVVDRIQRGIWLPTTENLRYDDYGPLLHYGADWLPGALK